MSGILSRQAVCVVLVATLQPDESVFRTHGFSLRMSGFELIVGSSECIDHGG